MRAGPTYHPICHRVIFGSLYNVGTPMFYSIGYQLQLKSAKQKIYSSTMPPIEDALACVFLHP